jgi:hypothetical protein
VRDEAAYRCSSIDAQPPASHPPRGRADHRVRGRAHRLDGRHLRSYAYSSSMHLFETAVLVGCASPKCDPTRLKTADALATGQGNAGRVRWQPAGGSGCPCSLLPSVLSRDLLGQPATCAHCVFEPPPPGSRFGGISRRVVADRQRHARDAGNAGRLAHRALLLVRGQSTGWPSPHEDPPPTLAVAAGGGRHPAEHNDTRPRLPTPGRSATASFLRMPARSCLGAGVDPARVRLRRPAAYGDWAIDSRWAHAPSLSFPVADVLRRTRPGAWFRWQALRRIRASSMGGASRADPNENSDV